MAILEVDLICVRLVSDENFEAKVRDFVDF